MKQTQSYNFTHRNVADMDSGGVYFDDITKEELVKQREELYCEYSGLPSVKAYVGEQN